MTAEDYLAEVFTHLFMKDLMMPLANCYEDLLNLDSKYGQGRGI